MVKSAQKKYVQRIGHEGLQMKKRGLPNGFQGSKKSHTKLLGGKQLAMAAYTYMKLNPDSETTKEIVLAGYPVLMRNKNMPTDVKRHLVVSDNTFHDGCPMTLSEMLELVNDVVAGFHASKGNEFTSRSGPSQGKYSYHGKYKQYVQDHWQHIFESWEQFDAAKMLKNKLEGWKTSCMQNVYVLFIGMIEERLDAQGTKIFKCINLCLAWARILEGFAYYYY